METDVSTSDTPVTDLAALMEIKLISRNLRIAVNGQDMTAQENLV